MKRLCINRRLFRLPFVARVIPVVIGISFLSTEGRAMEQAPAQNTCRQNLSTTDSSKSSDIPIVVSIKDLRKAPDQYYGKTVTVDGDMHRTFTDYVFTIEDNEFPRDHDVLVISTVPKSEAVIPLEHAVKKGKKVRVTGVVRPYDRGKLECAYGPLHLESREGHSFTKSPVLIVDETKSAKLEAPLQLEKPTPEVSPPRMAAPENTAPAPATPEPSAESKSLPKTAGEVPLLALTGLIALFGAFVKSFFSI